MNQLLDKEIIHWLKQERDGEIACLKIWNDTFLTEVKKMEVDVGDKEHKSTQLSNGYFQDPEYKRQIQRL